MRIAAFLSLLFSLSVSAWAGKTVVPTTTVAAETGNNTSGASSFTSQTNGNMAPRNVSKVPARNLLYPGATTRIYAHLVPWFGGTNHMNVGYRSDDPAQVQKQVTDMISRGIEGAIINWYGPTFTLENATTLAMMREAESRSGQFSFAVMEDGGALKKCANTAGCDVTQKLIDDLNYAYTTFQQSPAYMRWNGRPLVFFFGVEYYPVDWNRVRAGVLGDPLLVQRNAGAYTSAQMNGAYGWVAPEEVSLADPLGLRYMDYFYAQSLLFPGQLTYGSAYPGFNDTLSAWSDNRVIPQQCGQAWLTTMARASKYYSAGNQLPFLQLVTWNDYEEGTELETGIDNCVSVSATMTGTALNWTLTGAENTVDHFTVFISGNGADLMPLADLSPSARTLDVGSFGFDPGAYQLFVKAVGKPSLTNKMSSAVAFTLQAVQEVTVAAPFDGAAVTSPVRVTATGSSNAAVIAMQVYVDGVLAYQSSAASIDVALTMLPGGRQVVVKGWDTAGASFMKSMTINVLANKSPVALLAVTPLEASSPALVTASAAGSYDPDGTIALATIDFGDGYVASGTSAAHTYASPGTYTVKTTVADNTGATATAAQTVTVSVPQRYIIINSPGEGTTVSTKPRVSAVGFSTKGVQAMQVLVDGRVAYKTLGSVVDAKINLGKGAHLIMVKSFDVGGATFSESVSVTAN